VRKIPVSKWKIYEDGQEREISLLTLVTAILNVTPPREMPVGLQNFAIMKNIADAYERAEAGGELVLEEREYEFLRTLFERYVPASWASDKNTAAAVLSFIEAEKQ
jgi:hypothetical protein